MRSASSVATRYVLAAAISVTPIGARAQLISLKTVPLAAGEQFLIYPSQNLGMGGPSIAMNDALLDPFVNPAKGAWSTESHFFTAPTSYSISDEGGGASTLPLGLLYASNVWFAGGVAALQDIDVSRRRVNQPLPMSPSAGPVALPQWNGLTRRSPTNKYVQAIAGRSFGGGRFSLAASLFLADLNGIDGVEQLFANAWEIDEYGHIEDYRVGFTARLSRERTFEAVLVHNRFSMTHDVTSVMWELTDSMNGWWTPTVRVEENLNKTSTWGGHLGYVQPLGESDWRLGVILTANRKLHPKIPTYELETVPRIPRDPGESWAYNIGVGVSYMEGPTTFGVDVIYEPAVSNTWADALTEVIATDGTIIPAGSRTVENRFTFSNAAMRMGASHDLSPQVSLQLGVRMRSYDYQLRQNDHVRVVRRKQTEQWTEWTPSWGVRRTWGGFELQYVGFATSASHFPFSFPLPGGLEVLNPGSLQGPDILAAPDRSLIVPDATIVTHRITVSVTIR